MDENLKQELDALKSDIQGSTAKKEEVEGLIKRLDDLEKTIPAQFKEEESEVINKMQKEIDALKNKSIESDNKSKDAFKAELVEKKDDIKKLISGNKNEVVIKATAVRASVTDNEYSENINDVGQLATARRSMASLCRVFPISGNNDNGIVRYSDWDAATTVRAAAMVAEGGTFPASEAKWVQKTVALKKIGDTIPVSEELVEDSEMFYNELSSFLDINVQIKENDQILNADGTGENLTGLLVSIDALTPVAKGVQDPSVNDLIVVVRNVIAKAYGGKYNPNFVLANSDLIEEMELKKDANNNYVLPPFKSADGTVIKGMNVVEENALDNNALVVGDSNYMRLYTKGGYVLSKDTVASQFAEDLFTLKARKRLLFLIRNVDKTGFLKVTDVAAAITAIGQ